MGARGPKAKPVNVALASEKADRRRASWKSRRATRAERVIAFLESLPITQGYGAGQRMVVHPFQRQIIEAIYGPVGEDGRRLVRTALVTLPRKNGKSLTAAALVLNALCGSEVEPRGQIISAATDRAQASIVFNEILAMLDKRPSLAERLHVQRWNKTITDTISGSVYVAASSDARKAHGANPSLVVADEVAQWRSPELYHNLVTGMGGRREPLMVVISTRSPDPNHLMSQLVDYGIKVRDGVIEDASFAPIIYAAPEDSDWLDEDTWRACNPAIDAGFRSLDEMRVAAVQATRMPAREPVFRSLYLNQAVDTGSGKFIPLAEWQACEGPVDPDALRGRPCFGGLDLSSTQDLTSLCLFFPEDAGAILSWFWAPADRLQERQDRDRAPYVTWHAQGLLEAPAGRAIDRRAIARTLGEITAAYDVQSIAYDRWRIEDLQHVLADEGIEIPLEPFGQGYQSFGPAIDALETAIMNRELRHAGHPILTWCVSNAGGHDGPGGLEEIRQGPSDRAD